LHFERNRAIIKIPREKYTCFPLTEFYVGGFLTMALKNQYLIDLLARVEKRNPGEPEFIQTVTEVFESVEPLANARPDLIEAGVFERIVEPERQIVFRVPWVDDNGKVQVNRGFRVEFNSAIGPYKGGLRFAPNVYIGIIKFLGFEQIFKNSLTSLPMGGGKGGSDFDPQGKSDAEVMRFCQSFMTELCKHIGPNTDVPAGDIGVGGREIGYLFGQYKRIRNEFTGVLTGKGFEYGGSLIRPEATGYGAVYYTVNMLEHFGDTIKGKTVAVSGFGNVAWGTIKKVNELGGKVVTISGPDGYVYDPAGINTDEKVDYLLEMRASCRNRAQDYADKFGCEFHAGEKPWGVKADIIMPCATQNEVGMAEAEKIVANGVKYYVEVSNMPTSNEAIAFLKSKGVIVAPSKAVNAGGVAVSGLEMSQNSMRYNWTAEEVDEKLKGIMANIFKSSIDAANKYGLGDDLVAGANIAGFLKVAEAMKAQGVV
jgi:glutamate dehydrogenase (NADP+)